MNPFGLGALPSPPDPLDFPIARLYAARGIEPAAALPNFFDVGDMGTPLNQGLLPQCVAYGTAQLKRFQDRLDQAAWFAFNTALFFTRIGGGPNGAFPRSAYDQLLKVGYPLASGGGESQHKIAAYYRVPVTFEDIAQALMAFGPIGIGMTWYRSFSHPVAGLLPAADVESGGHFIVIRGFRILESGKRQVRLRNTWGAAYGEAGDVWMPEEHLLFVWEAWKAVDQILTPSGAAMQTVTFDPAHKIGTLVMTADHSGRRLDGPGLFDHVAMNTPLNVFSVYHDAADLPDIWRYHVQIGGVSIGMQVGADTSYTPIAAPSSTVVTGTVNPDGSVTWTGK